MYVGMCMSVCSCVCLRIACAYVNLNFWPTRYGTAHFTLAIPILHCFYLYKLNRPLHLLLQKTGQSAHASSDCSVSPTAVTILAT